MAAHGRRTTHVAMGVLVVLLVQIARVQCTGTVVIRNDLDTELRYVIYSDNVVGEKTVAQKGQAAFFKFDTSISSFYDVSMLAPAETPVKSRTIRVWSKGTGFPNDVAPSTQWQANVIGLSVLDPTRGWAFVAAWDST